MHIQFNELPLISVGDTFTIEGEFKRRSFWEWLRKKPRVLQMFVITEHIVVEPTEDG